ncbi:unnamed protein product [Periconia digitata]|uniref:Uncharacterized protein n=1 Tax=Periconia digitata TaxID=1303443 RepID=A0A9W4UGW6_9PLEO|nr:unnamed protein product [Periconia digitata]
MQEIELNPSPFSPSYTSPHSPPSPNHISLCISALRHSASTRLSDPPTRILQSNTNPLDRGLETLIFREILAHKSLTHIASNLALDGKYHSPTHYPEAYTYLLSNRPRLTADDLLRHVLWRLDKSEWWQEKWESALFGEGGKEGVAWALCETEYRESKGKQRAKGPMMNWEGDKHGGTYCVHGKRVRGRGCCGVW